jgi:uncharacterized membrane protein
MTTDLILRLGRGMGMWEHGYAFRWVAVFLFLGFLALLAAGVALLWRRGSGSSGGAAPRPDDALATLRMRYAKGEMTREEFLRANEDLGGPPPPPAT